MESRVYGSLLDWSISHGESEQENRIPPPNLSMQGTAFSSSRFSGYLPILNYFEG
jgi:hypothetical protein